MNILQKFCTLKFIKTNTGKSRILLFLALCVALFASIIISVNIGAVDVDILDLLKNHGTSENADKMMRIVFLFRLPRALAALFAGAALAVAGVLIQAVLNNPMAAPNIIGVNSGAGFAVILTMSLFPGAVAFMPFSAFAGAVISCVFIYIIANFTGAGRMTITLVGIAVSSILNAGISAVKTFFPNTVYNLTTFSIGGLGGVNLTVLKYAFPVIFLCIIISIAISRNIDILCLGKDSAASLGMNVNAFRFVLMILASALAGAAVSFAGLLGFVGLVVPHIVRSFTGCRHRLLVPFSALFGGEFVLFCDNICRTAFAPYEIPVGIALSLVGGIFFVCLIIGGRKGKFYD